MTRKQQSENVKFKYTEADPFLMTYGRYNLRAWSTVEADGGIMIKINCQEHSIEKWKINGTAILAAHQIGLNKPIESEELTALLFGTKKEIIERVLQFVEERKDLNKLSQEKKDLLQKLQKRLTSIIAAVEAAVEPSVSRNQKVSKVTAVKKA